MFDASASAMRNGTTGAPSRSHTSSVTGATSRTVVTLSSSEDANAVITTRITITRNGLPRARLTAQTARNSKIPVWRSTPTITIIPSSRNTTFQSTPDSSEKNAASASVTPSASITPALPSAAATRWIRSVAMRTYATVKTATAAQGSQPFTS
jgi:hypothetical protein